jgi:hypothetical protein
LAARRGAVIDIERMGRAKKQRAAAGLRRAREAREAMIVRSGGAGLANAIPRD